MSGQELTCLVMIHPDPDKKFVDKKPVETLSLKTPFWHCQDTPLTLSRHISDTLKTPSNHSQETSNTPYRHPQNGRSFYLLEKDGLRGGWGSVENNATLWLHLASWNLPDSQLSWESKMEPECGKKYWLKRLCDPLLPVWTEFLWHSGSTFSLFYSQQGLPGHGT